MTTETLSSSDDDRPPRRLPRWVLAVAVAVFVAAVATVLAVQHRRADERLAIRLAALDDANLHATITGGGTDPHGVQLEIAILNAGRHPVVVGTASVQATGVTIRSSTRAGQTLPAGASLTDEVQLNVACPAAADARTGGQLLIAFRTAANRRHILRVALQMDPSNPDGAAMNIIRGQCGAIDAAEATTVVVLQLVAHQQQVDITAELTNSGRSRLTVRALRLSDERLRIVASPRLPLSIESQGRARVHLVVTVAECGPEVNHDGITFSVVGVNEFGEATGNTTDDELDRAFRTLVADRCPRG